MTLGDRLRADGYDVEVATDGERGHELGRRPDIDLILLDVSGGRTAWTWAGICATRASRLRF